MHNGRSALQSAITHETGPDQSGGFGAAWLGAERGRDGLVIRHRA
jgi:hypothetical protein